MRLAILPAVEEPDGYGSSRAKEKKECLGGSGPKGE
jgi:hypothetical protein